MRCDAYGDTPCVQPLQLFPLEECPKSVDQPARPSWGAILKLTRWVHGAHFVNFGRGWVHGTNLLTLGTDEVCFGCGWSQLLVWLNLLGHLGERV